jgi:GTP-binding protein Era
MVVVILDAPLYAKRPGLLAKDTAPLDKAVRGAAGPVLIALNKIDMVKDKAGLLPVLQAIGELWPDVEIFPVSAARNQGVDKLVERVVALLPEGPPMYPEDQVSTVPLRFMAGEIVREKLFLSLRQELPYQTAVEIEQWVEEPDIVRIAATIFVGRTSHKAMVIGKGGAHLKQIGQAARLEIEELIEKKVFLELWVKVKEGWTEDQGFLRGLGLGE